MIEPTESEDKAELDRFCDAMLVSVYPLLAHKWFRRVVECFVRV